MTDIVAPMARVTKMSGHYRELAADLMPELGDEVVAVADDLDFEILIFVETSVTLAQAVAEQHEGRPARRSLGSALKV